MRQLFELCAEDRDIRFSPFVWRVIFCLHHKGLEFEPVPLMFLEKEPYAASNHKALPVLKDGDTWVSDSFQIAKYWLDHHDLKKELPISPNLLAKDRPTFDKFGNAIKVLENIRLDDPTGELADDATMLAATACFERSSYTIRAC